MATNRIPLAERPSNNHLGWNSVRGQGSLENLHRSGDDVHEEIEGIFEKLVSLLALDVGDYLEPEDLRKLKVKFFETSLNLETGSSEQDHVYLQPMSLNKLSDLLRDEAGEGIRELWRKNMITPSIQPRSGSASSDRAYRLMHIIDSIPGPDGQPFFHDWYESETHFPDGSLGVIQNLPYNIRSNWGASSPYLAADIENYPEKANEPHVAFLVDQNIEILPDKLARCELRVVFEATIALLRDQAWCGFHAVFLIILFVIDAEGRSCVTQAYLDRGGHTRIIRSSPYDLPATAEDTSGMETFIKWFGGSPRGETSYERYAPFV